MISTSLTKNPIRSHSQSERSHRQLGLLMWEGAYANLFIVLSGGAFLTGLALYLGADDFDIGLLAALPFLMQTAQMLSPYIFKNPTDSRRSVAATLAASRLIWLAIIPVLFMHGAWRLPALMGLVIVSGLLTMITAPAWLSWMALLVPESLRGTFFSKRNAAIAATTLAATITGSLILDASRASGADRYGYTIIVLVAVAGSVLAWRSMTSIGDRSRSHKNESTPQGNLLTPLRDRQFRRLLIVFGVWNIGIGLSASFFAPHMLLNLKMNFFQIGLYTCTTSLVAVVSSSLWGKLLDRFGSKSILGICAFGISAVPLVWLLPTADTRWILIPEAIYTGLLWAGFNLAAFTIPLDRSPRHNRSTYLSVFATVTGLAFFAASILGGTIAQLLSEWRLAVAGFTWINYHLLFVMSSVIRLITATLLASFHEPADIRLPVVVQLMGYAVLKRMSVGRQILPFAAEASAPETETKHQSNTQ